MWASSIVGWSDLDAQFEAPSVLNWVVKFLKTYLWANWLDVGFSLIGFEEPWAVEPWALESGGLSSTPECSTAPGWNGRTCLYWFHWRPPRGLWNPREAPPRKKGFPNLEAFPIVSAVSERVFRRCSKFGPNRCRSVSGKCSWAKETISGLIFFILTLCVKLIGEQTHLQPGALHVLGR